MEIKARTTRGIEIVELHGKVVGEGSARDRFQEHVEMQMCEGGRKFVVSLGDASRVFFTPGMTIRTVKLSLRPGALESFVKVYSEGALPLLRNVPGCLDVFLIVPADGTEEVVSVSLWSDRSAVEGYERSGLYARLLEAQEQLLSPLYRLRLTHEKEHGTQAASSEDVSVRHYALITGRTYAR